MMTPRRELEILWHVANMSEVAWAEHWARHFKNTEGTPRVLTSYRPEVPTRTELKQWSILIWKRSNKILNPANV